MVLMLTWKESCQLTFFTWDSSLTFKAEWLNLCKYLTHESTLRQWRWSQRLVCVDMTVFKVTVRTAQMLSSKGSHCHNTHLLWLGREITWKVTPFCTWQQTWDTSWNPRNTAAHMLVREEREPVCTSEMLAGLSKGALLHGLPRSYFRLPHRIGHGQQWTWIFPATVTTEFCLVFLLHPLTHPSMELGILVLEPFFSAS